MRGKIELELHEPNQLFNSMDPSPFVDRDLDGDAEEFIINWAHEYSVSQPLRLTIHLEKMPGDDPTPVLTEAIHNFFAYRAKLNDLEFHRLMAQGRASLLIGLGALTVSLAVSNLVLSRFTVPVAGIAREGLTIVGWVAMWRPIQIYLHDWWPLRRRGKVLAKLSAMPIDVVQKKPGTGFGTPGEIHE